MKIQIRLSCLYLKSIIRAYSSDNDPIYITASAQASLPLDNFRLLFSGKCKLWSARVRIRKIIYGNWQYFSIYISYSGCTNLYFLHSLNISRSETIGAFWLMHKFMIYENKSKTKTFQFRSHLGRSLTRRQSDETARHQVFVSWGRIKSTFCSPFRPIRLSN